MKDLTVSVATENTDNLGLGGIGVGTNVKLNVPQSAMIESGAALVSLGMEVRNAIHKHHLTTPAYADHKALNKYYDELVDLLDTFAENLQGRLHQRFPDFPVTQLLDISTPSIIISMFRDFLDDARSTYTFPELQNTIDEIQTLNSKTIYFLTMR
jgi:hypothetical protein